MTGREIRSAVVQQPTKNKKKRESKAAKEERKRKREEEERVVTKRRRTDEVDESVKSVQTEMTPQTTIRKEEQRQGVRRSGSKPWLKEGEEAWSKAGEKYGVEKVAAEELARRKREETRRRGGRWKASGQGRGKATWREERDRWQEKGKRSGFIRSATRTQSVCRKRSLST